MRCVCGDDLHDADCRCGCSIAEPDDGTPTHSPCLTVNHRTDRYEGIYAPREGYRA